MTCFLKPLTVECALEDNLQPHVSHLGEKFVQLYQRLPLGEYLYFNWEKNFQPWIEPSSLREHPYIPIVTVMAYLLFVFTGPKFMASRPSIQCRHALTIWNGALSLFSFIGMIRTLPDLLYRLSSQPFMSTIITPPISSWGLGATGLWVQLFVFSKFPELVDTIFLVIRKRPVIFLHWYHHVTVLLYCWHSYSTEAPQALYFVAMNYSVHSMMYGYYCLMNLKMKPKWLSPIYITVMQISQMIMGVTIQIYSSHHYLTNEDSPMNLQNLVAGGLMYLSYLGLFVKFALDRYSPRIIKKNK